MNLTTQEKNFLKRLKKEPFKLTIDQAMDDASQQDIALADALHEKGLCNVTCTPSKGYHAYIPKPDNA